MPRKHLIAEPDTEPDAGVAFSALSELQRIDAQLSSAQDIVVRELSSLLERLAGNSFGSLRSNQAVAKAVQQLLNRLGQRVECPRCKSPSFLRCRSAGYAKHGAFQFEHIQEGRRTNHKASSAFPQLKLIPAPPDQRRKDERDTP